MIFVETVGLTRLSACVSDVSDFLLTSSDCGIPYGPKPDRCGICGGASH